MSIITSGSVFHQQDKLTSAVKRGMVKPAYPRTAKSRNAFRMYASSASHCSRQEVLAHYNNKQGGQQSAAMTGYVNIGNSVEDIVRNALDQEGLLIAEEVYIPTAGLNIGGKIDAIVQIDGELVGVEIKSCGNSLPNGIRGSHLSQAAIYSALSGLPLYVLYFSRNVADFRGNIKVESHTVDEDKDLLRRVLTEAVTVSELSHRGLMPNIPEYLTAASHCGFCGYKENCWGGKAFSVNLAEYDGSLDGLISKRVHEIMMTRQTRKTEFTKIIIKSWHVRQFRKQIVDEATAESIGADVEIRIPHIRKGHLMKVDNGFWFQWVSEKLPEKQTKIKHLRVNKRLRENIADLILDEMLNPECHCETLQDKCTLPEINNASNSIQ